MTINNVCEICLKNDAECHCSGLVTSYTGSTRPADISDYSRITNPPIIGNPTVLPGHYSGFISDKLAKESRFMGLIKMGLDADTQVDWTDELKPAQVKEMFPEAYTFLKNLRPAYSDSELLFIAKLMYTAAGLIESLTMLSRFYNLSVSPEVTTVNGRVQFTISEGDVFTDTQRYPADCIIDVVLFQDYFKTMVQDLLFYKDPTLIFDNIRFRMDVVNVNRQSIVNMNYNAVKKWFISADFLPAQY